MKLSKLYSNRAGTFGPVEFRPGLNVVMAEIRLPENRNKDTHNLGKTTLGLLIDFCLLTSRDPDVFPFSRPEIFGEFVFFLEVQLLTGSYVTIRRGLQEHTKISFKKHQQSRQDFSGTGDVGWDHLDVPFDKARELLDGLLDLEALKPWSYRKGLGYLIRSQVDFGDVFQLRKFAGKHAQWKPYLAHVLGFNAGDVEKHYDYEEELAKKKTEELTIEQELGGSVEDLSKIEGMLLLKEKDVEKRQALVDAFDFRTHDKAKTKALVGTLDERIAELNAERYTRAQTKKRIEVSLKEDQIMFDPAQAEKLFTEVGILFPSQVKADYEELIRFNKAITEERKGYLQEELGELDARLKELTSELNELGKERQNVLAFLTDADVFEKYKRASNELVSLRADIVALRRQRGHLKRLQDLRTEIRSLKQQLELLQTSIETDVEAQNEDQESLFSRIRLYFAEIIQEVIDRPAVLNVFPNQLGHLEFKVEILDESGRSTSADSGFTYRKLLCIAFDMAILRAHLEAKFPRFVYHDGVFESLDQRKKENLIDTIRDYCEIGLQHVITLIDSDLPPRSAGEPPFFEPEEIVLLLHDEGPEGRLFKMNTW